jgi:hypothetical protein
MKTKTVVMGFLAVMLAMSFSQVARAHTEDAPFVTDLIAGQTMDVGDVSVWNDATHLYVRYATAGDWSMTYTHLHVAIALDEIPQKNGNPTPGHFDHTTEHDPACTEYTYAVPLDGWMPASELYIAAHADVIGPGADGSIFAQGTITTVTLWTYPDAIEVGSATVAIEGENLVVTFEAASIWALFDTQLYVEFTAPATFPPQWWLFPYIHWDWVVGGASTDTFTIPREVLGVQCNDVLFISTHARLTGYDEFGNPIAVEGWGDENPFDGWTKYFWITIPCGYVGETAWGDGLDFPGNNWAMYFTYVVQ